MEFKLIRIAALWMLEIRLEPMGLQKQQEIQTGERTIGIGSQDGILARFGEKTQHPIARRHYGKILVRRRNPDRRMEKFAVKVEFK